MTQCCLASSANLSTFIYLSGDIKKNSEDIQPNAPMCYFAHEQWPKSSCCIYVSINMYSQTCIKRSPLEQRKSGLIRQVTSFKRGSIHMKCSTTGKEKVTFKYRWLLNRGDHMGRLDSTFKTNLNKGYVTVEFKMHKN